MLGIENIGANVVDGFFGEKKAKKAMQREKAMANFYHDLSMKKWRQTGVRAQANEMRRAGLNVGLMHGNTAGAQGQTTVTPGGDQDAPNTVQSNSNFLDMALAKSQIKLMEAQAKKEEAIADKTAGVDTKEAETRIDSLTQGIENQKAQEQAIKIQNRINEVEERIKNATEESVIRTIDYTSWQNYEQWESMHRNNEIDEATMKNKIEASNVALVGMYLDNKAKRLGMSLTRQQINKVSQEVYNLREDVKINWRKLSNEEKRTAIQAYAERIKADNPELSKVLGSAIMQNIRLLDNLMGYDYQEDKNFPKLD